MSSKPRPRRTKPATPQGIAETTLARWRGLCASFSAPRPSRIIAFVILVPLVVATMVLVRTVTAGGFDRLGMQKLVSGTAAPAATKGGYKDR